MYYIFTIYASFCTKKRASLKRDSPLPCGAGYAPCCWSYSSPQMCQ